MPIRTFSEWTNGRGEKCLSTFPLSHLKDAAIGIDASYYLDLHLHRDASKEPLLTALGGFPFALKASVERDLQELKQLGITAVFVFPGLDFGKKEFAYDPQSAEALQNDRAWELYDQGLGEKVVEAFGKAGTVKPEYLHRLLQRILLDCHVEYMVAPYSASAQLAYLERQPSRFIDAVMGYDDLLLFDVEKIITKLDFADSESGRPAQFTWLSRKICQEELGRITTDKFVDGCLLLGSPFLPTFPPLEHRGNKPFSIQDAIGTLSTLGGSVTGVCNHYHDNDKVNQLQYLDRYKRAIMTLRHHVVLFFDGKVGPMSAENAPSDVHDLIGQRLPEELYFYISKGILGPQIPNWLTSGEIQLLPPYGIGDDQGYRRLMGEQLTPIRTQALCLLSNFLHRFYHSKVIGLRLWFDPSGDRTVNLKDLPSLKEKLKTWNVKRDLLQKMSSKSQSAPASLRFGLECLKDTDFASLSSTSKDTSSLLSTKEEILSNIIWRFLQLRDFVGQDHQLTAWGKCLASALASLKPEDGLDESVFVAVELMRMGLLSPSNFFTNLSGGPMRGSDEGRQHRLLVSRVACIAKLRHRQVGYSGPLSRQLVAYQAVISAVRRSLRDLIEVCLTGLLLNGDASRDRNDWEELPLGLPFIEDNDCGLAIIVRTYFDELVQQPDTTIPEVKNDMKMKSQGYFQHIDSFGDNLDVAFKLWDAVYPVSQSMGKEFKEAPLWKDVNAWLVDRR